MDHELNTNRLGHTRGVCVCFFFFTRELCWTEFMLDKYRQSVLKRKHKQILHRCFTSLQNM